MKHHLFLPFVVVAMVVWVLPTAGAPGSTAPGQQGRPRRAPEQCAHDVESAHARHRAEARRCAHQKHRGPCDELNDRRLNTDLARINAVCGDYISTQGEPDRGNRLPPPADPGGGPPPVLQVPEPAERPHSPPSEDPGLLPPGFPFPPAEARPPRSTPTPRQPADRRPVIVALGDSITAGYRLKVEEAYPALLQRRFDAEGYRYRVLNAGVTGDTSTDARRRLDQALVPNTRIVIVALGLNDFNMNRPIAEIRSNMAAIVEQAKQRGITVLLCGFDAPPAFNPSYEDQFKAIYPALAARSRVSLLPDLLARVWPDRNMVQRDFIHPTAAGARVIADDVFRALRPMLGAASAPRSSRPTRP